MRYCLNWKLIIPLVLLLCLAVLIIRGCCVSCFGGNCESPDESAVTAPTATPESVTLNVNYEVVSTVFIDVYDHRADKLVRMGLEEYIVGVVSGEMPASFEAEALKAQAVASRTYSAYCIMRRGCGTNPEADICTNSNCCQAYASEERRQENWGKDFELYNSKISAAVMETAGEVLVYEGTLIEALYHSNSGGSTENVENVYSTYLPYLRAVLSPVEVGGRDVAQVSFGVAEFIELVNTAYPEAKLTADKLTEQVEIESAYESGRVEILRLGGAEISGKQARKLFDLNSALFTIELGRDKVNINTRGFGHGVGMSQGGANGMAKEGSDYREILLYYYTGVEIAELNDEMLER